MTAPDRSLGLGVPNRAGVNRRRMLGLLGGAAAFGAVTGNAAVPPDDTGEALGLPAARLTLTVGFGATLFASADGRDRFGLAAHRPAQLDPIPAFPDDALDPAITAPRWTGTSGSSLGTGRPG